MRRWLYWPLTAAYALLSLLLPKNKKCCVFLSFPDCSDNAYALFRVMLKCDKEKKGRRYVWLVDDVAWSMAFLQQELCKTHSIDNVRVVQKNSVTGLFLFLTAGYAFFTHGTYWFAKSGFRQCVVNLWHGMPLKRIGLLDGKSERELPFSHYVIATSGIFQDVMARAFGKDKRHVLVCGQPRNDWLFDDEFKPAQFPEYTYEKCVLWMPTYRQSVIGDIRQDGGDSIVAQMFRDHAELETLNTIMAASNALCVVKLHPMDVLNQHKMTSLSNVLLLTTEECKSRKLNNYALIKAADCLLTDYSSVFIDYMLLGRPIGFVVSDLTEYSRGFAFDFVSNDFFPGVILESIADTHGFLKKILNDKADFKQQSSIFVSTHQAGASERLLEFLNIR